MWPVREELTATLSCASQPHRRRAQQRVASLLIGFWLVDHPIQLGLQKASFL
jgi:hypothetical protein